MGEDYNVPFERPLQALALAALFIYIITFLVLPFVLWYYIYVYTTVYYLGLLYVAWIIIDYRTSSRGGRRLAWARKSTLWIKLARDYFPMRLIKTVDLDPTRNYLCGSHPHGYMCFSAFSNFAQEVTGFSETFPGITPHLLSFSWLFQVPFFREFLLSIGNCSTTKESIEYILTKKGPGNAVMNVVGGAAEIPYTRPYHMMLVLKDRKGFVKMAIRCGADLLPILHFGEGEIFDEAWRPNIKFLDKFDALCKKVVGYHSAMYNTPNYILNVILHGMPKRKPLYTYVGKPIEVIKDENPSQELIDEYHSKYIEAVKLLFEESKMKLGPEYHKARITIM